MSKSSFVIFYVCIIHRRVQLFHLWGVSLTLVLQPLRFWVCAWTRNLTQITCAGSQNPSHYTTYSIPSSILRSAHLCHISNRPRVRDCHVRCLSPGWGDHDCGVGFGEVCSGSEHVVWRGCGGRTTVSRSGYGSYHSSSFTSCCGDPIKQHDPSLT